jgi:hypothetical protein
MFFYCLEAVQRPVQPSDRTNEPDPLLAGAGYDIAISRRG